MSRGVELPPWAAYSTAGRPHAWATKCQGARGVPTAGAPGDEWSFCLKIPTSSYSEPEGFPGGNVWWTLSRVQASEERAFPGAPAKSALTPQGPRVAWGEGHRWSVTEGSGRAGGGSHHRAACSGFATKTAAVSEHNYRNCLSATDRAGQDEGHSSSEAPEGTQEVPGATQRPAPILSLSRCTHLRLPGSKCPLRKTAPAAASQKGRAPQSPLTAAQQREDPRPLPPSSNSKDPSWTKRPATSRVSF